MRGTSIDWDKYGDLLASTMLNKEIAKVVGCSAAAVGWQRRRLYGKYKMGRKEYDWSKWEHVVNDPNITINHAAQIVGCSYGAMEYRRKKAGMGERPYGSSGIRRFNYRRWVNDFMNGNPKPLMCYHEKIVSAAQMREIEKEERERDEMERQEDVL